MNILKDKKDLVGILSVQVIDVATGKVLDIFTFCRAMSAQQKPYCKHWKNKHYQTIGG